MPCDYLNPIETPENLGFSKQRLARIGKWLREYVNSGKLPFGVVKIIRDGHVVYSDLYGMRDVERSIPVIHDGLYRIYSMTKPITTVAAMSLYEEGYFMLDDPVAEYLPEFLEMEIYKSGSYESMNLVKPKGRITIRQLMNHTSGLTYGAFDPSPVGRAMRRAKVDFAQRGESLAAVVERLAPIPLCFEPGTRWNYGVSTDVLGRMIEVISGKSLEQVLEDRIFKPLKMLDTSFAVPEDKLDRLSSLYARTDKEPIKLVEDAEGSIFRSPVKMQSGGGGLLSTVGDYVRFIEMLRKGGELEGERVLGRKTVDFMMMNHLPGDMESMGQATFSEMPMAGIGFGLGGAVLLDPTRAQILGSIGEFTWGGMASTAFWVDKLEKISVVFMTQLMPSSSYPIRRELRVLVYQALVD